MVQDMIVETKVFSRGNQENEVGFLYLDLCWCSGGVEVSGLGEKIQDSHFCDLFWEVLIFQGFDIFSLIYLPYSTLMLK